MLTGTFCHRRAEGVPGSADAEHSGRDEKAKETGEEQDAISEKPDLAKEADLQNAEAEFRPLDVVHQKLNKTNRKLYALQKQQRSLQNVPDTTPRDLFHKKEQKALEDRIAGIGRQIDLTRTQLEAIPKQHGFGDVKSAEAAYKAAKENWNH